MVHIMSHKKRANFSLSVPERHQAHKVEDIKNANEFGNRERQVGMRSRLALYQCEKSK